MIPMIPQGHAAIITGGGSGLGAATALRLGEAGAKVAVLDLNLKGAEEVAAKCNGIAVQCDVGDAKSGADAVAKAREKHGAARILINCAGIGLGKRIVGKEGPMPLEDFSKVIQTNLIGTFNMLRLAAADMATLAPLDTGERGVIVSTASIAAYEGQIGQPAYSASKGGIVALTMPAARELAQFGIRVMTIAPGIFLTPLLLKLPEEVQASLGASVPFPKRLGQPPEFAELVMQILENLYLNGEVIRLDGALRMAPK
jgi:NAD(P)-dependent dehydrogenase (short-subunit alcohol dehydrogenase family)